MWQRIVGSIRRTWQRDLKNLACLERRFALFVVCENYWGGQRHLQRRFCHKIIIYFFIHIRVELFEYLPCLEVVVNTTRTHDC